LTSLLHLMYLGKEEHADARHLDIISLDDVLEKLPRNSGHNTSAVTTDGTTGIQSKHREKFHNCL